MLRELVKRVEGVFLEEVPEKGIIQEQRASIHSKNSTIWDWARHVFGGGTDDTYNDAEAYSSTLVWRAIKVLSEPLASMPIEVFEKQGDDAVKVSDHPVEYLLNTEPNPWYSAVTWKDTQMHHLGIKGNGYNEIIFRGNGDADRIQMIDPDAVTDIFVQANELLYEVKGRDRMISSAEMLHFVGPSTSGFKGKSPIDCHMDTLILDREMRRYGKNLYQNGAFLSGVLSSPNELSDRAYNRMKDSWAATYGGSKKAGKTALLEEGVTFQPIMLDPISAAWLESRKAMAADIARIYGVPVHMLMELDRSTFNNIEHQSLEYILYSLTPWIVRMESEINRKLFRGRDRNRLFVKFNMDELRRGDMKTTGEFIATMQDRGNLNINEVRRKHLNLPGIEGGDEHLVQGNNMVPLTQLLEGGQQLELQLDEPSQIEEDEAVL